MTRLVTSLVPLIIAAIAFNSPARGANYSWSNASGGSFHADANWTGPVGYPDDGTDTAIFNLLTGYTVQFTDNVTNNNVEVNSGTLTWDLSDGPFPGDDTYEYTLDATSGLAAHIGSAPGSIFQAKLIVTGRFDGDPLFAGASTVFASRPLQIGRDANSQGALELDVAHWISTSSTVVGLNGFGSLQIDNARMDSAGGSIGSNAGSSGTVTVKSQGLWNITGGLTVGGSGGGTLTIEIAGDVGVDGVTTIAGQSGSSGTIVVEGPFTSDSSVYVGGTSIAAGGIGVFRIRESVPSVSDPVADIAGDLVVRSSGEATIEDDGVLSVGGLLRLDPGAEVSVAASGGTITSGSGLIGSNDPLGATVTVDLEGANTSWTMTGGLFIGSAGGAGAQLEVADQATISSDNAFVASAAGLKADVRLHSAAGTSQWSSTDSIYLGGTASASGGTGTLILDAGGAIGAGGRIKVWNNYAVEVDGGSITTPILEVVGTVDFNGGNLDLDTSAIGELRLAGGTVIAPQIDLGSDPFTGFGALAGEVVADGSITAAGNLVLGDANSFNGVVIKGNLNVGAHQVTVNKKGFFNIGGFTNIAGGTLLAPNGVNVPGGNSVSALGAIGGRVVAQAGSVIEAAGSLALGDPASVAGFFSDGELYVKQHTVTIHDANEALLGSLTSLGAADTPGSLVVANGAVVEFGKNIVGYGTVDTPNIAAKPLVNNGFIGGSSAAEPITLTGYVKGVGSLDNVVITGTDAPGFSPATVIRGSVVYDGALAIEIGGTSPGAFDRIEHELGAGVADLGGALNVSLINGFAPLLGDAFQFLTASGGVVGKFETLLLPALAGGMRWEIAYGANDLLLTVEAALAADFDVDGDVDGADLAQWQGDFAANALSDADDDGDSDGADFLAWQQQLGAGALAVSANVSTPEPTSISLCIIASAAIRQMGGRMRQQLVRA